ncbi:MAG: phosphoribosylaminoimidazolesuccinocarboxamide synthase [Betaproteobacteria bacterium RIFCSPLOWO2_12_FULL_68_19]|nr:MAG: phosphoribosylaminoimidazolesuccinocarboxamide synthase [Betaproteobacteria bacterium RIFCSPLOWO2_12_FULL_68_19]
MALFESKIKSLPRIGKGKVRDIYAVGDDKMLIVASDRLSAFDVVLPDPIPDKGKVLNQMANFWFERLRHIVPNQLTSIDPESIVTPEEQAQVRGRSVVVKKLKPLPIEAVVRGYLIGSGWKDYQRTGAVCGIELPKGLRQAEKLPQPIFTPATKAETGHDQNISFAEAEKLVGKDIAAKVRDISLRLYKEAADYAATKGIIIADTKFEFGLDERNDLVLIDEVLTADSSRFWPADSYQVGISPPSYDKQYVRDYLETLTWDKTPPAPKLPPDVISRTSQKYRDALERLTGRKLA